MDLLLSSDHFYIESIEVMVLALLRNPSQIIIVAKSHIIYTGSFNMTSCYQDMESLINAITPLLKYFPVVIVAII